MLPAGERQKETFLNTLQYSLHNYAQPQEKVVNQSLLWLYYQSLSHLREGKLRPLPAIHMGEGKYLTLAHSSHPVPIYGGGKKTEKHL